MLKTVRIGLVLYCAIFSTALCAQSPETNELKKRIEKKTLYIRGFPDGERVEFGPDGAPSQEFRSGSWTYGQIYVERVKFEGDKIEISGKRVGQLFEDTHWKETRTNQNQVLEINRIPSDVSSAQLSRLLETIFVFDKGKIEQLWPNAWLNTDSNGKPRAIDMNKLERVGGSVKPPQPIATSKSNAYQDGIEASFHGSVLLGAVVDESGQLLTLRVQQPLGMGLDEKAMKEVRGWKFEPAMKKGKPVPVVFNIEVSFNLH